MSLIGSPFLARVVPRAIVVVIVVVALLPAALAIMGGDDPAEGLGGDYAAFYAAGRIVLEGDADQLYDPLRQRAEQVDYHDSPDEFLYFAYPPFVAAGYAVIAWVPYGVSLTVHSLLALAALASAIMVIVDGLPVQSELSRGTRVVRALALALVTYPIVVSILGGQNTAFSILIIAATWRLLYDGRPAAAGLVASLMLFKPQFAVVILAVVLVLGLWRALVGIAAGAGVMYLVGAALQGLGWIPTWLEQVRMFGDVNVDANGALLINILGWLENLTEGWLGLVMAGALIVGVSVVIVIVIWSHGRDWAAFGPVTAATLLVAPAALFYDLGIAIVGFGVVVALGLAPVAALIVVVVASWSQLAASALGWSPLFILLGAMFIYQAAVVHRADMPRERRNRADV